MCGGVTRRRRRRGGGIFFKYRGVDNYGLNECSQSASLSVCKKRKAQRKPLQGRLITPRKRGNINGRFCGYNVTAKRLHRPQHVKRSHSYFWRLLAAPRRCVFASICAESVENMCVCTYCTCTVGEVWFVCGNSHFCIFCMYVAFTSVGLCRCFCMYIGFQWCVQWFSVNNLSFYIPCNNSFTFIATAENVKLHHFLL